MNIISMAAALAMVVVSAASAQPSGPLGQIVSQVSLPVPYGDLDLTTPEGIAAMHVRLVTAARDACRTAYEGQSFKTQLTMDCRITALDAAQRQLAAVTLAAQASPRGTELAARADR